MKYKIHMFSHYLDLDGIGSPIIGKTLWNKSFSYKLIKYGQEDIITNYLKEQLIFFTKNDILDNRMIIICDLSIRKELAEVIDVCYNNGMNIKVFEHHIDSKEWEDKNWMYWNDEYCATVGFYMYCLEKYIKIEHQKAKLDRMKKLIKHINLFDIWTWIDKDEETQKKARWLNKLLYERTADYNIMKYYYNPDFEIYTQNELEMLEKYENDIQSLHKLIKDGKFQVQTDKDNRKYIMLKDNEYLIDINHVLFKTYKDIDYLLMIYTTYPKRVSYRSNNTGIANQIASKFGGGGHPDASGGLINDDFLEYYFEVNPYE